VLQNQHAGAFDESKQSLFLLHVFTSSQTANPDYSPMLENYRHTVSSLPGRREKKSRGDPKAGAPRRYGLKEQRRLRLRTVTGA
jgi:hypothetical protein